MATRFFDDDDDDPVLLDAAGLAVDTWRENYPYDHRMSRNEYEEQKRLLQIELLKLQKWSQTNGLRHVLVFEGGAMRQARAAPSSASWSTSTRGGRSGGGAGEAH